MRMRWLFGRGNVRAPWIVAILVLINALLLRAIDPPELSRLRDLAFDSYQRLKPRTYNPAVPVRIVDIDEEALAEHGQWPWPRTILARLVDKLTEQGAAVIAFDVVFAEPDRSSLSRMVRDLVAYTDPETVQKLAAAVQDNDQVLADAMAHSRVVLGFGFDLKGGQTPPKRHHGMAFAGDNPLQFLPVQQGTVKAIPLLEAAAKGNGSVNTDLETVVIRRVPMLFRLAGTDGVFPTLSIEAVRVAQGANSYVIKSSGANLEESFGIKSGIVAVKTGDVQVRTDARGRMILYDTGHRSERYVSAADRAEGHGAGRQDRRPDHLHRHQRDRAEGHAQHAGRRRRARRRGPRPARRADADAGLPRPAGFRRRRGIPLPRAASASCSWCCCRACRPAAWRSSRRSSSASGWSCPGWPSRNTTCCSIRSIRR